MPVYNKVTFVKQTLDSALNQTYPYLEILVINDGSTDGSLPILESYARQYPEKIKLIDSINQGVSAAMNLGIKRAKGEYIQFLDADDCLSPDKIERQISLLQGKASAIIACCEWVMFRDDLINQMHVPYGVFGDFPSGLDWLLRAWNHQEMMQPAAWLAHLDLILKAGPWNESLIINQDGEFFCRVLLQCKGIAYEPNGKVFYRIPGESNVSQQKSPKAFQSLLESYRCYEIEVLKFEDSLRVRKALKKVYQKFIYDAFPEHTQLIKIAESYMESLGVKERTFIGGPKFQNMSKILGFKNALRLKKYLQKK
ncbi:glycosyltransferase [Litoribacter ruber]|uniref:glycosyltransferase n=1 Tax=Litoribacter ruber TaxID=702568 RepID=UPI00293D697F|nr:glycosyltransferase [Litoribacter alkaliphilus]